MHWLLALLRRAAAQPSLEVPGPTACHPALSCLPCGADPGVPAQALPGDSCRVEYFGVKLEGFCFTEAGWVQSYGSRYVRPPIIYADITRPAAMTVKEFQYAQVGTPGQVRSLQMSMLAHTGSPICPAILLLFRSMQQPTV